MLSAGWPLLLREGSKLQSLQALLAHLCQKLTGQKLLLEVRFFYSTSGSCCGRLGLGLKGDCSCQEHGSRSTSCKPEIQLWDLQVTDKEFMNQAVHLTGIKAINIAINIANSLPI